VAAAVLTLKPADRRKKVVVGVVVAPIIHRSSMPQTCPRQLMSRWVVLERPEREYPVLIPVVTVVLVVILASLRMPRAAVTYMQPPMVVGVVPAGVVPRLVVAAAVVGVNLPRAQQQQAVPAEPVVAQSVRQVEPAPAETCTPGMVPQVAEIPALQ
jgi:hypothetical protein